MKMLLHDGHVFSARAFVRVTFGEGDTLSLLQLVEAHSFKVCHVKEKILFSPSVNESKTTVCQSLNRTFCHYFKTSEKLITDIT